MEDDPLPLPKRPGKDDMHDISLVARIERIRHTTENSESHRERLHTVSRTLARLILCAL